MKVFLLFLISINSFSSTYNTQGLKVYGNWCGPMHGSGEPIDELDKLCMEHDLCYSERGMFNCSCDDEFVNGINETMFVLEEEIQEIASLIAGFFSISPCVDL